MAIKDLVIIVRLLVIIESKTDAISASKVRKVKHFTKKRASQSGQQ